MPPPTEDQFVKIANNYLSKWNFPNCIGAIDGKHIRIRCPKKSGSAFFNYKEFYSTVMLGIVDADYKFVAIDIGSYGREGDAGIYLKSKIGKQIQLNKFNIPPPKSLPGTNTVVPHVIVGDEAFALHENLMKPYPRKQSLKEPSKAVYNYRLCRARRTVENAFGILCAYFRIFFQPIATVPETTDKLIISACLLHNLLRDANIHPTTHINSNDVMLPKNNFLSLTEHNIRAPCSSLQIREMFKDYFNGCGAVEWQNNHLKQY